MSTADEREFIDSTYGVSAGTDIIGRGKNRHGKACCKYRLCKICHSIRVPSFKPASVS